MSALLPEMAGSPSEWDISAGRYAAMLSTVAFLPGDAMKRRAS